MRVRVFVDVKKPLQCMKKIKKEREEATTMMFKY